MRKTKGALTKFLSMALVALMLVSNFSFMAYAEEGTDPQSGASVETFNVTFRNLGNIDSDADTYTVPFYPGETIFYPENAVGAPSLQHDGHTFLGWINAGDGATATPSLDFFNTLDTSGFTPGETYTYTAKYKAINKLTQGYIVKFVDADDTTTEVYPSTGFEISEAGGTYTLTLPIISGYVANSVDNSLNIENNTVTVTNDDDDHTDKNTDPIEIIVDYKKSTELDDVNTAKYEVNHLFQTLDGDYIAKDGYNSDIGTGKPGDVISTDTYKKIVANYTVSSGVASGTLSNSKTTVLNIYYDLNTITLTFDTQGGTPIAPITAKVGADIEDKIDAINAPTKGGHDFDKWSEDFSGLTTMPESDKTYTASWTQTGYDVIYWLEKANLTQGGAAVDTTNMNNFDYLKTVAVDGTDFNVTELESIEYYDAPTIFNETYAADGTKVYNVIYTRKVFTLKFDREDAGNKNTVAFDLTINGSTTRYDNPKSDKYVLKVKLGDDIAGLWPSYDRVTFYDAEDKEFVLRSWKKGSDDDAISLNKDIHYVSEQILPDNPIKNNVINFFPYVSDDEDSFYTIKYYLMDNEGNYPDEPTYTIKTFNNGISGIPLVNFYGYWQDDERNKGEANANGVYKYYYMTATAQIRFDQNGGLGDVPANIYGMNVGSSLSEHEPSEVITKDGYKFVGWADDVSGENIIDWSGTMPFIENVTIEGENSYRIMQLYAAFVPYDITFDADDATLKKGDDDVAGNKLIIQNDPMNPVYGLPSDYTVEKDSYILTGWTVDKGGDEPYDFTQTMTADITLYPIWVDDSVEKTEEYKIKYRVEDPDNAGSYIAEYVSGSQGIGTELNLDNLLLSTEDIMGIWDWPSGYYTVTAVKNNGVKKEGDGNENIMIISRSTDENDEPNTATITYARTSTPTHAYSVIHTYEESDGNWVSIDADTYDRAVSDNTYTTVTEYYTVIPGFKLIADESYISQDVTQNSVVEFRYEQIESERIKYTVNIYKPGSKTEIAEDFIVSNDTLVQFSSLSVEDILKIDKIKDYIASTDTISGIRRVTDDSYVTKTLGENTVFNIYLQHNVYYHDPYHSDYDTDSEFITRVAFEEGETLTAKSSNYTKQHDDPIDVDVEGTTLSWRFGSADGEEFTGTETVSGDVHLYAYITHDVEFRDWDDDALTLDSTTYSWQVEHGKEPTDFNAPRNVDIPAKDGKYEFVDWSVSDGSTIKGRNTINDEYGDKAITTPYIFTPSSEESPALSLVAEVSFDDEDYNRFYNTNNFKEKNFTNRLGFELTSRLPDDDEIDLSGYSITYRLDKNDSWVDWADLANIKNSDVYTLYYKVKHDDYIGSITGNVNITINPVEIEIDVQDISVQQGTAPSLTQTELDDYLSNAIANSSNNYGNQNALFNKVGSPTLNVAQTANHNAPARYSDVLSLDFTIGNSGSIDTSQNGVTIYTKSNFVITVNHGDLVVNSTAAPQPNNGDDITPTPVPVLAAAAAPVPGVLPTPAADDEETEDEPETETIDDNPTPQGGTTQEDDETPTTETIEDDEVATASFEEENSNGLLILLAIIALLVVATGTVVAVKVTGKRNRKVM